MSIKNLKPKPNEHLAQLIANLVTELEQMKPIRVSLGLLNYVPEDGNIGGLLKLVCTLEMLDADFEAIEAGLKAAREQRDEKGRFMIQCDDWYEEPY